MVKVPKKKLIPPIKATDNVNLPKFDVAKFCVQNNPAPRLVILGSTGSGKTVLTRNLVARFIKNHNKIFLTDPKNEFDDIKALNKSDFTNYKFFARKIRKVHYNKEVIDDPYVCSEFACSLAWNFAPAIAYCEEIPESVGKHESLPHSHYCMYKVLQEGRAQKAGIIVVSQMMSDTHLSFIRQSSAIFIFAMLPAELKVVEKTMGFEKDTLKFDLPTKEERENGILKDLYSFYVYEPSTKPVHYHRLEYKKPERKKVIPSIS